MSLFCGRSAKAGLAFSALAFASLLTGCGADLGVANEPTALPGTVIRGNVHGGVYPIQGATIRLMQTQSNGVWNATTKNYVGTAKQLLQTTSDNNGNFNFPDTGWTCDSNQSAYITVTSGNTAGSTKNNNVAQIGVIGNCGQLLANQGEIDAVQVFVSELSTIAAAYTLRSFISVDNTNAASGQQIINITAPANNNVATGTCTNPGAFTAMTCTAAGLSHGFENALNLVDSLSTNGKLPSGQARTSPATNSNAYAPQEVVNTLGNILQSCVDSSGGTVANYATYTPGGSGTTRCGDLFYYATPPGGTPPTNTLQAALNMAQFPTNNVTSLYNLQPRAVFFTPTMNQVPNDLTVSLFYLTETFGGAATQALTNPVGLALDDDDNAYILVSSANGTANTQTAVLGMASNGTVLFAGPVNTTYLRPTAIATDSANNVWVTNDNTDGTGAILKVSAASGAMSVGAVLPSASGLAVDKFNNVLVSLDSTTANSIQVFYKGTLNGGTVNPLARSNVLGARLRTLTLDGSGNAWSLNTAGTLSTAVVYPNPNAGGFPFYGNTLTQGNLSTSGGFGGAPNASGQMFFPLAKQVSTAIYNNGLSANNLGTFTGSAQNGSTYNIPNQSQVDGAGNVFWTDTEASGNIFQFVPPASGSVSGGKLNAILPCYPQNGYCYLPAVVNSRSMQIDSSGALWYTADANFGNFPIGVVIETFGVGAPSWPMLALQQPGVVPK